MRATSPVSIHDVTQCSYALFRFHPLYSVSKDTMISNIFSLSPKSHRHISVPSITESTIVSGESRVTLRVCLLGLLKGRRGNILAGSKTFRLRINRFKNFPLRNTILLSQRTRGKDKNYFVDLQKNNNCDSCCFIIRKALRILWILGAFRFLV